MFSTLASGNAYAFGHDAGQLGIANVDGSTLQANLTFYHDLVYVNKPSNKFVVRAITSWNPSYVTTGTNSLSALLFSDGTTRFYGYCTTQCGTSNSYFYTYAAGEPLAIAGQSIVDMSISPETGHALYCTGSGKLFIAGNDYYGEWFMAPGSGSATPTEVNLGAPCKQVIASGRTSLVLLRNGTLVVSGTSYHCLLGIPHESGQYSCNLTLLRPTKPNFGPNIFISSISLAPNPDYSSVFATGCALKPSPCSLFDSFSHYSSVLGESS